MGNKYTMRIYEVTEAGIRDTVKKGARKLYTRVTGRPLDPVTRIDAEPIQDFDRDLKTYRHSADWSGSGQYKDDEPVPKELDRTTRGLFAGDSKLAAAYAVPRTVKSVAYVDPKTGDNVIAFDVSDRERIQAYRPTVSTFDPKTFKRTLDKRSLGGSEYVSDRPGKPTSQRVIDDPIAYMQDHGWRVKFVSDITKLRDQLKSAKISHNAENL